ncbi:MAG: hypothetical protein ACLTBR_03600 [Anaerostipes sp.]|uniref:hypothetical protein n=1 Tax=Anaerostipes sp. TaxID=1872530 RepID=UPI003992667C
MKEIPIFDPYVTELEERHRDLFCTFRAGRHNENFTSFLQDEALDWMKSGDGVTYLVIDRAEDVVAAYFTLAASLIPFIDRIKEDDGSYNEQTWGIPSIEIKMFAVNERYQNTIYQGELISASILAMIRHIIVNEISPSIVGAKAIFLHSTEEAENFYLKNDFCYLEGNMRPVHCVDDGLTAMYYPFREFFMNYEE